MYRERNYEPAPPLFEKSKTAICGARVLPTCDLCDTILNFDTGQEIHPGTNNLCHSCCQCINAVTDESLRQNIENFLIGNVI